MAASASMIALDSVVRRAVADLERSGCRMAIVGGLAVAVRAEPRFTRDIDCAVAVAGDPAAEALVHLMHSIGYEIATVLEQRAAGRLATVRLVPPGLTGSEALLDLLFASSGIEPEVVTEAERMSVVPGVECPVARTGHLLALESFPHKFRLAAASRPAGVSARRLPAAYSLIRLSRRRTDPLRGCGRILAGGICGEALKVLARDDQRRPLDIIDIRALLPNADAAEIARARRALVLIMERGFHRGRDLLREFDAVLAERGSA